MTSPKITARKMNEGEQELFEDELADVITRYVFGKDKTYTHVLWEDKGKYWTYKDIEERAIGLVNDLRKKFGKYRRKHKIKV